MKDFLQFTFASVIGVILAEMCIRDRYYRGCWHGVSRSLFVWYIQKATRGSLYSHIKEVYNP